MSTVNAQVTVITRGENPTEHKLEVDLSQTLQLSTTDSSYTTDTTAFSTTVWNYYNSQVGASNVDNVEARWVVWVGGDATGGGSVTNDGVFGTITGASDIQTELNSHIAHALTGDVVPPGA